VHERLRSYTYLYPPAPAAGALAVTQIHGDREAAPARAEYYAHRR